MIDKVEIKGIVNFVSSNYILVNFEKEKSFQLLDSCNLSVRLEVPSSFEAANLFFTEKYAIYQSVGLDCRELYLWDFIKNNLVQIHKFDADLLFIGLVDNILVFKSNKNYIVKLDVEKKSVDTFKGSRIIGGAFIYQEKIISLNYFTKEINYVNLENKLLNTLSLKKILPDGLIDQLSSASFFLYSNSALLRSTYGSLVCIDILKQKLSWFVDECVGEAWSFCNEGKVYSVFQGNLKIIDAETGSILLDKPIETDWVQDNKQLLNLFQVNVSSTHLWCGFLGHGLCAINLETAQIDWHEFDGQTLNSKPIIKNNRIYIQLMSGGIGLDNAGTQSYILEGEGGYREESDNEFIVF